MSLETEDDLITKNTSNCVKKKTNLCGRIFSIENLLSKGSKTEASQNASDLGISTRGSSENEDECEDEDYDGITEDDEVERCKTNGDQKILKILQAWCFCII